MIYSRQEHWRFLEEELRAQTEAFKQKLDTSALFLLQDREELFVAQFLKFQDGDMVLKFSISEDYQDKENIFIVSLFRKS